MSKITLLGVGLLTAITISSSQVMAAQSFQDPIKNTQKLTHIKTDRMELHMEIVRGYRDL